MQTGSKSFCFACLYLSPYNVLCLCSAFRHRSHYLVNVHRLCGRCSSIPLSKDRRLSFSNASADRAIIGMCASSGFPSPRISLCRLSSVHNRIWISIKTSAYSPSSDFFTFSTAMLPFFCYLYTKSAFSKISVSISTLISLSSTKRIFPLFKHTATSSGETADTNCVSCIRSRIVTVNVLPLPIALSTSIVPHYFHNIPGNRQSQASSVNAAKRRIVFPFKRLKNVFLKLFC